MDLAYTTEQNMLEESISKFVSSEYDLDSRKQLANSELGYSDEHWQTFASLGWLALPIEEAYGGIGGDLVDTMILFESLGKGLVVEPILSTLVLFGGALSIAYLEAEAPSDFNAVTTSAVREGDAYVLNGHKSVVFNAASADHLIVSARTEGDVRDLAGISLFIVPSDTPGITRKDYPTVDGLRASEIALESVSVPLSALLGQPHEGASILNQVINRGILAVSAEAVGAMEVLYKSTIDYTKQREQFDHPLADFQVVKHRLTEMFIEYNLAKSLCMKATMLLNQGTADAQRHVHALKFLVGKSSRFVGQNAVQLHGGMGMTEDLAIAHYFKRLMIIDALFGNANIHLEAFTG
jgi:alkylation response protein AidB-like acyl-CoA dehydrogenase